MCEKSKKRILIIAHGFPPSVGGYQNFCFFLASGLASRYIVTVVTDTILAAPCENEWPFTVIRGPNKSATCEEGWKSDLIIYNSVSIRYLILLFPFIFRSIVIHHTTYPIVGGITRRAIEFCKRLIATIIPLNICVSHYVERGIGGKRIVIHNPYDEKLFFAESTISNGGSLLFVGRLVEEKGVHLLLRAFQVFLGLFPSWRLTIIGDGPEKTRLIELARVLGLYDSVEFIGQLGPEGVAKKMRHAAVLVVPSVYEPFGIVALEGLASGCIVVHSDEGGLVESCGNFGESFRSGNVESLVAALKKAAGSLSDGISKSPDAALGVYLHLRSSTTVIQKYISVISKSI